MQMTQQVGGNWFETWPAGTSKLWSQRVQRVESRNWNRTEAETEAESQAESHRIEPSGSRAPGTRTQPLSCRCSCWPRCHIDASGRVIGSRESGPQAQTQTQTQTQTKIWYLVLDAAARRFVCYVQSSLRNCFRLGHISFAPVGLANFLHTGSSWKLLALLAKLGGKHNMNGSMSIAFWQFPLEWCKFSTLVVCISAPKGKLSPTSLRRLHANESGNLQQQQQEAGSFKDLCWQKLLKLDENLLAAHRFLVTGDNRDKAKDETPLEQVGADSKKGLRLPGKPVSFNASARCRHTCSSSSLHVGRPKCQRLPQHNTTTPRNNDPPLESPSGLGSKRTGFDVAAKFQCSQRKLPPVGSIWVEVAQEVGH